MDSDSEKPTIKSQLPGIIIALATAGTTFWLYIYEYWPIDALNYLQSKIFLGYYSGKISFFITWLLLLLPFVLAKFLIKKMRERK